MFKLSDFAAVGPPCFWCRCRKLSRPDRRLKPTMLPLAAAAAVAELATALLWLLLLTPLISGWILSSEKLTDDRIPI